MHRNNDVIAFLIVGFLFIFIGIAGLLLMHPGGFKKSSLPWADALAQESVILK
jgi:hypothetical protein